MSITGGYINVDGIKTYFETNNGPKNPNGTLVCLHTAGRESRQYHAMMEIFAHKFTVVAFDMPAHGKSWPLPGNVGISNYKKYGEFVWKFIEAMGIDDPIIAGCSVGGNMVYYIAETYPVKAMICMQGSPQILAMNTAYGTTVNLLDNPYVSCQHSHWDFSESLIGTKTSQEARDFIMWGVCQECGRAKQADLYIYNNYDVTDDLDKITCPCLLIRGEDDWNVPDSYYDMAMKGMTNAERVVFKKIPGYGHFIAIEAPDVVCELIEKFFG